MSRFANKAGFWGYRFLLATELLLVALLVMGGCYSKQNYRIMDAQSSDERLSKCNVVVEGRIVYVFQDKLRSWQQHVFCYPLTSEEPTGPDRYNVSIDIDKVLKGDPAMPRRLQVNKCRPLTSEEAMVFSQMSDAFPDNVQVRIGFNSQHGNSFSNLIVVPLGPASTTKPTVTINPSAPAAR